MTTALLLIDDARIYGLIEDTGAYVDRHRCHRVLSNLRHEGVRVDQDEVSGAVVELMAELGVVRS